MTSEDRLALEIWYNQSCIQLYKTFNCKRDNCIACPFIATNTNLKCTQKQIQNYFSDQFVLPESYKIML